jgi:hypothetical protein
MIVLLITFNISYGNYSQGVSYGKSLLGDLGKVTIDPNTVPGYSGIDNKGLDNASTIEEQTRLASQGEHSQFIHKQFNREHRITLSDKDELIVGADKLTKNPVASVAQAFNGKVQETKSSSTKIYQCESSGSPYLISCKYLLKPVPYYGEKQCEEQFEKSIESCTKTLEVKPIYDTKTCEQKGNSIIKRVVATLEEKTHERVSAPIIERVYKGSVKFKDTRHTPYSFRGKPHWTRDCYLETRSVRDGTRLIKRVTHNGLTSRKVPNYKHVPIWKWEHRTIGHQMVHPRVTIVNAEYKETPVIERVKVLPGKWDRSAVYEYRLIRWDRVLTKSRTVNVPSSIFHWVGGNVSFNGASCVKQSERCIDNNDKSLYGITVKQPCWKKEITYKCDFPSKNNCEVLRNQGCSQSSGKCLRYVDRVCVNYENTMECFKSFSEGWVGCDEFKDRKLCNIVNEECTEKDNIKLIAGRDVTRSCWAKKINHACSYKSLNNCEQLRLPSCKQIKKVCIKEVNGTCVIMGRTYKCVDGVNEEWETNCHDLEKKALDGICTRVGHKSESPIKKSIDGFDHLAAYRTESMFKCLHPSKNNCSILKARGCLEKSKKCIKKVSDTCVVWSKTYECLTLNNQTSQRVRGDIPKCLDGSCRGDDDINDSNIGDAVTRLAVLQEVGKQSNGSPTTKSIFGGTRHECRYSPVGIRNCCKLKGWGNTLGLTECSPEEEQLSHLRSKGFCVPTGKYCKTKVLGGCLDKRYTFCCYKGAMPKVFQLAAHGQLNINWNAGKHPNCRGLSIEEIQRVKLSGDDVKEIAGAMGNKIRMPDVKKMQESLTSQMIMAKQKGGYVKEPPKAGEKV